MLLIHRIQTIVLCVMGDEASMHKRMNIVRTRRSDKGNGYLPLTPPVAPVAWMRESSEYWYR